MHGPNSIETESDSVIQRRTRIGLRLLSIYGVIYGLFIGLCAFASSSMAKWFLWGVPLSIWYGLLLMIGAIVMALLYGRLCRSPS